MPRETLAELRAEVAQLRCEVEFIAGERRTAEDRERKLERECSILRRRLGDIRACLAGVQEVKGRIIELNAQFQQAQSELTLQVLQLEVPPSASGHDAMNSFLRHG